MRVAHSRDVYRVNQRRRRLEEEEFTLDRSNSIFLFTVRLVCYSSGIWEEEERVGQGSQWSLSIVRDLNWHIYILLSVRINYEEYKGAILNLIIFLGVGLESNRNSTEYTWTAFARFLPTLC